MVSRLLRFTPNCDYAEVQVIHHPGSHHQTGDVILMSRDEFERGRYITTPDPFLANVPDAPIVRPYESAEKFLNNLPHKPTRSKKPNASHPRGKSKAKSKVTTR